MNAVATGQSVRTRIARLSSGALLAAMLPGLAFADETIRGQASVIDGDTLRIGTTIVGLYGVAAPAPDSVCETAKDKRVPCGSKASAALAGRIGAGVVECETRMPDAHRRILAVCRLGNEDLNAWMVATGLAVSERFKAADYYPLERKAWGARRGLWAGVFSDPTERKRTVYEDVAPTVPPTAAALKMAAHR